ncbi:MAG: hypothetical protein F6K31_28355 [Symploca sp. SIO2G7]|nr:hypothetical protein [Symploca sp. SIO2G7]
MSDLTREETWELLKKSVKNPQAVTDNLIVKVLIQLGLDPNAKSFPPDTVEKAEQVFVMMGVATQQALSAASASDQKQASRELVVTETAAIASTLLEAEGIVGFDSTTMLLLAQTTVENAVEMAEQLTDLKEKALVAGLQQGNQRLVKKLMSGILGANSITDQVFSDEAQFAFVNDVVEETPVDTEQLRNYLSSRRKARLNYQSHQALPPKINVKVFLAEQRAKATQ